MTERIGFWVNLDEAYVTYHQSYVESVWWSLKQLFDRGLLYQGYKIVWWWAQGGTALSAGEVGQGYREVADPSVYVKFPLVSDDRTKKLGLDGASLLVWTTTPWTLPSNQFVAVNKQVRYSVVIDDNLPLDSNKLILAFSTDALILEFTSKNKSCTHIEDIYLTGEDLIGLRYRPPFDIYSKEHFNDKGKLFKDSSFSDYRRSYYFSDLERDRTDDPRLSQEEIALEWRIVPGDFVTTESGTGIVHIAPAFGEDDFDVLRREQDTFYPDGGPKLRCPVAPTGKFTDAGPDYCRGRWIKDCDRDITRDLKQRGLLYHQEQYLHEYPFCWRAEEDPLIQYPRESWFIRTSNFIGRMLFNNKRINWLPEHIRDGRFGNFLETNVDWALSRERFWGTPLPIWKCEKSGRMEAVSNYDELLKKPGIKGTDFWDTAKKANPNLADDLKVHKPYIDALTYDSPFEKGARMQRVTEVIDCWYDSGAMPFAQWGWPHQNDHEFKDQFPADFISEALDQTRGWFYSQLAISTLLFGSKLSDTDVEGLPPRGEGIEFIQRLLGETEIGDNAHSISIDYPHPFRNCIVLGLMLGEDGQKMSKSKRNYREPGEIFDKYGADALRWYFFATQPPWTTIRYSERAIRDSIPEFLLRLWNVYSFFVNYANIDSFEPEKSTTSEGHQTACDLLI